MTDKWQDLSSHTPPTKKLDCQKKLSKQTQNLHHRNHILLFFLCHPMCFKLEHKWLTQQQRLSRFFIATTPKGGKARNAPIREAFNSTCICDAGRSNISNQHCECCCLSLLRCKDFVFESSDWLLVGNVLHVCVPSSEVGCSVLSRHNVRLAMNRIGHA